MELLADFFSYVYLGELVKPLLSENLKKDEEIRVSYRQYRTENKGSNGEIDSYNESYWILTNKALINLAITANKIDFKIFTLDSIVRINKSFEVNKSNSVKSRYVNITFSSGDKCELYPPETNDELNSIQRYGILVKLLRDK